MFSLKDDRESLEIKMKKADAVIFATLMYTYNVAWIMKNFLDCFVFVFYARNNGIYNLCKSGIKHYQMHLKT